MEKGADEQEEHTNYHPRKKVHSECCAELGITALGYIIVICIENTEVRDVNGGIEHPECAIG